MSALRKLGLQLLVLPLIALLFAANLFQAISLGMDRSVPSWYIPSIAPAVADLYFGHPPTYTGLVSVRDEFESHLTTRDTADVDQALVRTVAMPRSSVT